MQTPRKQKDQLSSVTAGYCIRASVVVAGVYSIAECYIVCRAVAEPVTNIAISLGVL